MNERPRGNVLREMTEEEALQALAARQVFGPGRWEYVEDAAEGTPVLHIGPIPPEEAWEGKREEALAVARVYREIAPALKDMRDGLADLRDRLSEDDPDERPTEDELHALGDLAGDYVYRLSGLLRDGFDSDDMDISAPGLFHEVFKEMVQLSEGSREDE